MKCNGHEICASGNELVLSVPYVGHEWYLKSKEIGAVLEGDMVVKRFPRSRFFYTPKEIAEAKKRFLLQTDFVFGMSGYSDLDSKRCLELDITPGRYEAALSGVISRGMKSLKQKLPGVRHGFVYGSSAMGVDLVVETTSRSPQSGFPIIGVTCLEYLWYVSNAPTGPDICIVPTKKAYCETYVGMTQLLLAANGGEVSYKMDIHAATEMYIPVVPVDVLKMLGAKVPAFVYKDGKKRVNDAVGALYFAWRMLGCQWSDHTLAEDRFEILAKSFSEALVARAREVSPPERAYI